MKVVFLASVSRVKIVFGGTAAPLPHCLTFHTRQLSGKFRVRLRQCGSGRSPPLPPAAGAARISAPPLAPSRPAGYLQPASFFTSRSSAPSSLSWGESAIYRPRRGGARATTAAMSPQRPGFWEHTQGISLSPSARETSLPPILKRPLHTLASQLPIRQDSVGCSRCASRRSAKCPSWVHEQEGSAPTYCATVFSEKGLIEEGQ